MAGRLVAGLDVGRKRDRTALVRLDSPAVRDCTLIPAVTLSRQADLLEPMLRPCALVAVDATGLGLGLAEALAERGLPILPVQIVAGSTVHSGETWRAGKRWLVMRIQRALSSRLLSCPPTVAGAGDLLAELQRMVRKWQQNSPTVRFEASAGHDDLVLALALALLAEDAHGSQAGAGSGGRR